MAMIKAALVLTGIAIALLIVYGADVIAVYTATDDEDKQGFIPLDHAARGIGLGGPALLLPLIAYFISRKEPSRGLGIMLMITGILIIIGGVVVIGNADPQKDAQTGRNVISETAPLVVIGLVQIGLGVLKIKRS